jgi:hypothetical protein
MFIREIQIQRSSRNALIDGSSSLRDLNNWSGGDAEVVSGGIQGEH